MHVHGQDVCRFTCQSPCHFLVSALANDVLPEIAGVIQVLLVSGPRAGRQPAEISRTHTILIDEYERYCHVSERTMDIGSAHHWQASLES